MFRRVKTCTRHSNRPHSTHSEEGDPPTRFMPVKFYAGAGYPLSIRTLSESITLCSVRNLQRKRAITLDCSRYALRHRMSSNKENHSLYKNRLISEFIKADIRAGL